MVWYSHLFQNFPQFIVIHTVKVFSTMQEARVRFLGWEDHLKKEMATHFSVLAWRIPGTGAWWAAIYGVTQSPTRLKRRSSSSSSRDFSGGMLGGLVFQSLEEFSTVCCDPHSQSFGIINKTEVDVFLELSCLFDNPTDVDNLISGSTAFSKSSMNICWNVAWRILSITLLAC